MTCFHNSRPTLEHYVNINVLSEDITDDIKDVNENMDNAKVEYYKMPAPVSSHHQKYEAMILAPPSGKMIQ